MTPTVHFKQFGRYEIIRKLGRSMTDVYLALDPLANRRAVLKIIEQCRDPLTQAVVDAERRGAAIQQQLHALDPRILEIYEYGEQDGCFFVAMQYAEGKSLAEILRREGRLEPMRAVRYAADVASQLGTLHSFQPEQDGHQSAVVHGDIKPSNIQIGPNDEVWLLDFGIAKAITATRNVTAHNLGSPVYCSPERLRNARVDPQADLWALGVSLYEMMAGLPPYQAESTRRLENLIQSRRPPRALPETCPPPLRAIISKALAGDIDRRYLSAAEFEADLRRFLMGKPTAAEREKDPAWQANETLEKPQPEGEPERQSLLRRIAGIIPEYDSAAWAIITGLIIGLLCFIPVPYWYHYRSDSKPLRTGRDYTQAPVSTVSSDWQLYQRLRRQNDFLGRFSPALRLGPPLRAGLVAAANDVIERYRNGSDPVLEHFEWQKARTCLSYALELDKTDREASGKLAIADGYTQIIESGSFAAARERFHDAAAALPRSPDPHLGLARVFVYGLHNIGQAMAEFDAAERLGYRLGPREFEQQADGYLYRAEQSLRTWEKTGEERYGALAQRDFERARNLYEPIAGFSNVDASLDRLYKDEAFQKQLQVEREKAKKIPKRRTSSRYRRWR